MSPVMRRSPPRGGRDRRVPRHASIHAASHRGGTARRARPGGCARAGSADHDPGSAADRHQARQHADRPALRRGRRAAVPRRRGAVQRGRARRRAHRVPRHRRLRPRDHPDRQPRRRVGEGPGAPRRRRAHARNGGPRREGAQDAPRPRARQGERQGQARDRPRHRRDLAVELLGDRRRRLHVRPELAGRGDGRDRRRDRSRRARSSTTPRPAASRSSSSPAARRRSAR